MKDFVSGRRTPVVALAASMWATGAIFFLVPYRLPWTGPAWGGMALCAGSLLALMSTHSMRHATDAVA